MANTPRQAQTRAGFPKRGEIYLVTFDPTIGHESQKNRPAPILQNDVSNRYSPLTIVAAISSQLSTPPLPREVIVQAGASGLSRPSAFIWNQIRTVDKRRLIKRLGVVDRTTLAEVDEEIQISPGLIEL